MTSSSHTFAAPRKGVASLPMRRHFVRSCAAPRFVLDVEPGGAEERYAVRALERDVVFDRFKAQAAWSVLLETCGELARRHSYIDRLGLQQVAEADKPGSGGKLDRAPILVVASVRSRGDAVERQEDAGGRGRGL